MVAKATARRLEGPASSRLSVPLHVYMLRCGDSSFYVGHTDDLEVRIAAHAAGEGCDFTRQRQPVELVWSEQFATRDEALAMERKLKGWGRAKKQALVEGDWRRISQLGSRGHSSVALRDARRPLSRSTGSSGRTE